MIKLIVFRYALYTLVGLEVFLMPILISDKFQYANYEYLKSIIFLTPSLFFGASTGYIYQFLKKKCDLTVQYALFIIIISTLFGISLFFLMDVSFLIILICSLYGINKYFEKLFQANGKIGLSMSVRPIFALFTVSCVYLSTVFDNLNIEFVFFISLLFSSVIFAILAKKKLFKPTVKFNLNNFLESIILLVKSGFLFNSLTVIYGGYLFVDRFWIKTYFENSLPTYSITFSLMQVGIVGFSALAIKSTYDFGSNMEVISIDTIKNQLYRLLAFYLILVILIFLGGYIYTNLISEFNDFYLYLIPFTLGAMFISVLGVFFPLLNFLNLEKKAIICLLIILILKIFSFYIFRGMVGPLQLIWISSLLILTYGLYSYRLILNKIK